MAQQSRTHHYYFDYIRVFAMFCVVFMHLASGPLRVSTEYLGKNWHAISLATSLSFTAVPLFFMMSGYLLMSSSRTAEVGYLMKKRLPRLAVPLVVWSLVAVAILVWKEKTDLAGGLKLLAGMGSEPVMVHFWFMYTLIAIYLVSPVLYGGLHSLTEGGRRYLLGLMVLTMALLTVRTFVPQELVLYLPDRIFRELTFFSGHLISFLLGWYLGTWERRLPGLLVAGVGLADLAFITVMTFRRTVAMGGYNADFQLQNRGFEILLAACIFLFCKHYLDRPLGWLNRLTTPVAALAFPVYLLHAPMIHVLMEQLDCMSALGVVVSTLKVAGLSYLIVKTLATVKPLCYLTTGLSWSEACGSCNWLYTFRIGKKR